MSVNGAATPGEVHPWYASSGALTMVRYWLEHSDTLFTRVLVLPSVPATWDPQTESIDVHVHEVALTRRQAWGRAPYVGCPFVYTWQVAVDSHGRQVAERESHIAYTCYCWEHRWNRS